jgi:hypothetical protein
MFVNVTLASAGATTDDKMERIRRSYGATWFTGEEQYGVIVDANSGC